MPYTQYQHFLVLSMCTLSMLNVETKEILFVLQMMQVTHLIVHKKRVFLQKIYNVLLTNFRPSPIIYRVFVYFFNFWFLHHKIFRHILYTIILLLIYESVTYMYREGELFQQAYVQCGFKVHSSHCAFMLVQSFRLETTVTSVLYMLVTALITTA